MNVSFNLWRSFAGSSIIGIVVAGCIQSPTTNNQRVDRIASPLENRAGQSPRFSSLREASAKAEATPTPTRRSANARELPMVPPIVSGDPTSAQVDVKEAQPIRLNSAQIALKEAKVAVSLSQAQLAQARMNLIEFQAKHDKAKILAARGKVTRQQAALAVAAYNLAQLQHTSASIGLRESQAQLIAARAEANKLGLHPSLLNEM